MTVLDILASIEHPRYHAHPHFYSASMIFLGGRIVEALRYMNCLFTIEWINDALYTEFFCYSSVIIVWLNCFLIQGVTRE